MPNPSRLDPTRVRKIVAAQFAHVRPRDVRLMGVQGSDHESYDVDGEWIVRFPKTAAQVARIEIEHRIVAAVADRLPIAVPRFELIGRASEDFPFVFTGYRKLPGTPWDEVDAALTPSPPARDEMACEIGEFLTALHNVSEAEARSAGVLDDRSQTPEHRYEELSGLAETIEQRLPAAWRREIDEFFARGMIAAAHAGPAVLAHNDLLAEHVLIDSGSPPWRVCGVIDWGDVALADPAVDFVGLHCWAGAAFVREVRRHYRGPCDMNDAAPRIAFIAQCWALNDLAHVGVPRGRYSLQRALHHVAMAFGSGEMNS